MNPHEDKWGILQLQNCILKVAHYIDQFCEKCGVQYCLMGGSALGAVRHKGFIPWDDDLDIFMRPEDYTRFRNAFNDYGDKENFYLQEWGAKNGKVTFAKLRMNNTCLVEKDLQDWDMHHGVYVDIFILHTCPDSKVSRYNQLFWSKYLVAKGAANRHNRSKHGLTALILRVLELLPDRFLLGLALKNIYKYSKKSSENFCHFLGRAGLKTGLYKREYFSEVKRVPFESITLCVPSRVEDYLKDRWGDYMKLPSKEEIAKYQHSWKWSDSEEWRKNVTPNHKDEKNLLA